MPIGREHIRNIRALWGCGGQRQRQNFEMTTKIDLSGLIDKALFLFDDDKSNRAGDPIIVQLVSIIEEITGEELYDGAVDDTKSDMIRRESVGQGVKRLSNSADVWALEPWFGSDKD
jgi:hypothetical protein